MYKFRIVLSLSVLMLAALACNAVTGIRAAQTDIPAALTAAPAALTAAPTELGAVETSVAEFTPPAESTSVPSDGTPSAGGLGINLDNIKTVMQVTQQFTFADGTVDGKPATIAKLTATSSPTFPTLAAGFSAAFIGDPQNLSEIKITLPRTDDKASVDEAIGLAGIMLAEVLPADVQADFLNWLSQTYSQVPVDGSKETTVKNFKFTLSRTKTEMLLDIVPAQ